MSTVHKDVILEALAALTGTTLIHQTEVNARDIAELKILNFLPTAFTGKGLAAKDSVDHSIQALSARDAKQEMCVNLDKFLDPQFDYDFTDITDDSTYRRGNELYKRPCGWYRFALKVLNKYCDGNDWLGPNGFRHESAAGEWPVSYHGTSESGARGITEGYYEPGSGKVFGRGIYSTPDILEASHYSKVFLCEADGKRYRVILQNRINPQMRKKCPRKDYWLIEIPEGTRPAEEKKIVEKSVRPYGILLKEFK